MLRNALQVVVLLAFAVVGFAGTRLLHGAGPGDPQWALAAMAVTAGQAVALLGDDAGVLVARLQAAVAPGGRVVHVRPGAPTHWKDQGPFDLVVLTESPGDATPLLRQVRAALRPTGRLVVQAAPPEPDLHIDAPFARAYHAANLSDADPGGAAVRKALDRRFAAATRNGLASWRDGPPPAGLHRTLAADLSLVLDDRTLVAELNDTLQARGAGVAQALIASLPVVEARLLQWLVLNHDDEGLLEPGGAPLDPRQTRVLRTIHRLLLSPYLGPVVGPGDRLRPDPAALLSRIEHAGFRRLEGGPLADTWSFAVQDPP